MQLSWEALVLARMRQFMYFNPTLLLAIRAVGRVMDRKKRSVGVRAQLTPDEKEALERRAKALGISISEYLRRKVIYTQLSTEEILAREWVAIALQIRKMRSDGLEKQQLKDILEELKQLIARTISR